MLGQPGEVEGHQVRGLARFQGTGVLVDAKGPRAIEGGHAQGAMGIQGAGRAGYGLGQEGGGTGFAEQVQVIVAGCAIGADGDVHAGLP
ncbi:hypothetical protein D9M71_207030 [compost metagenome]